ncbi:hypothetical protein [Streptomyces sp. JHA26]|uniref:hypothetical protein n=1 Tax=Streptomyces sp. JHA26 TaxID=1917143 RepID=UPI00117DE8E7|nr:hypothetical protein [Streptomyces sp. JHA26]
MNRLRVLLRSAGTLTAGTALAVGLSAGTANAVSVSWNAQYTQADISGAHAWGSVSQSTATSRIYVTTNIRDSASDSKGARVFVRATYQEGWGGSRTENLSASGYMAENQRTWNFDYTTSWIEVMECKTEGGVTETCAGWHKIWGGP